MQIPQIIKTISKELKKHSAKAILVGGSVRDYYLNLPIKDYDIEIYGLQELDILEEILSFYGSVSLVGKSFGVYKLHYDGEIYDFSFPRRESKIGIGHKDFDVKVDAYMSFKEASLRRDFTINAMGYDIESKLFLNPYNGLKDIEEKKLRHVDSKTFIEDPLRVYRAIQFCARFEFGLVYETFLLCRNMVEMRTLETLPKERVYIEFTKLLLRSPKPSVGFELMLEMGVLRYFKELKLLSNDRWMHTMKSLDTMVTLLGKDEKLNLIYMFTALCLHLDSLTIAIFLQRFTDDKDLIKRVLLLVKYHLRPSQLYAQEAKDAEILYLATKVNITELVTVAKVGFSDNTYLAEEWLLKKAKILHVDKKPLDNLLQGRDLISIGIKPSPKFSEILDEVYRLQIEGKITTKDKALKFAKRKYNRC